MTEFVREGSLLSIGDKVRIEPGPRRVTAKATEELLGSATADHYRAPVEQDGETVYATDADGQPIRLGKNFTYLDWVGFQAPEPERVFYLYQLQDRTPEEREDTEDTTIWREVGFHDTEEQAISAALSLGN